MVATNLTLVCIRARKTCEPWLASRVKWPQFLWGSRHHRMISAVFLLPHIVGISEACNGFAGFRYVPPADAENSGAPSSSAGNRQTQSCVPCNRGLGLSQGPSSKFLWPTTAAPSSATSAPCCSDTGSTKLENATGRYSYKKINRWMLNAY